MQRYQRSRKVVSDTQHQLEQEKKQKNNKWHASKAMEKTQKEKTQRVFLRDIMEL